MGESILERIGRGPVLGDEGYLLELEKRTHIKAGPFTPMIRIARVVAAE